MTTRDPGAHALAAQLLARIRKTQAVLFDVPPAALIDPNQVDAARRRLPALYGPDASRVEGAIDALTGFARAIDASVRECSQAERPHTTDFVAWERDHFRMAGDLEAIRELAGTATGELTAALSEHGRGSRAAREGVRQALARLAEIRTRARGIG